MTEKQYNSKLLGDKLSQLPVLPNEALWSRIEAQLLAVPPVVQQPPAGQQKKLLKALGVKTGITIVSTVLLIVFVLWLAHQKPHLQQATPAIKKTVVPIVDSVQQDTTPPVPVKQKAARETVPIPGMQVPLQDTQPEYTPASLHQNAANFSLRDTTTPAITNATLLHVDSMKPLPEKKKEEEYYFEVKRKKN